MNSGYGHAFTPEPRFYFRHQAVWPGALFDPPVAVYGNYGAPGVTRYAQ
jgi:hypothetical protein